MNQTIAEQIAAKQAAVRSLEEGLPYADHGAYGQDKQRIAKLLAEIRQLRAQQEAAHADTD